MTPKPKKLGKVSGYQSIIGICNMLLVTRDDKLKMIKGIAEKEIKGK